MTNTGEQEICALSRRLLENDIFGSMPKPWIKKNIWSFYRLLFLVHCSLIKNRTQTAVIDILSEFSHFYKLDISYAIQHIFSKVILSES